jgi:hypothetical protein
VRRFAGKVCPLRFPCIHGLYFLDRTEAGLRGNGGTNVCGIAELIRAVRVQQAGRTLAKRHAKQTKEIIMGRGILLWLIGVPIPIIILLALIWH